MLFLNKGYFSSGSNMITPWRNLYPSTALGHTIDKGITGTMWKKKHQANLPLNFSGKVNQP